MSGFVTMFTPATLLYLFAGCIIGVLVGTLPGMGATAGISITLPLTFSLSPLNALIMLSGIYSGNMYGGAITAILLNVPGTNSAAMTAIDGYQMTVKGKAAKALSASQFSSFIGSMVGTLLLAFLAVVLTQLSLMFSAPEYFALTLMGLTLIAGLTGKYPIKGYLMMFLGLGLSTIGLDAISGKERFVFGQMNLVDGLKTVPLLIGILGFCELLNNVASGGGGFTVKEEKFTARQLLLSKEEWRQCLPANIRGTVIGFIVGALPGAGGTIATVLAYGYQKKKTKSPDFGLGAIDGVAVCESANNASTAGAMGPMLALGIPGSPSAALLMTAFMMFGMTPGPRLFDTNGDLVWALIASMFVGNIFVLLITLNFIPAFLRLISAVQKYLTPLVATLCFIGVYSLYRRAFDIGVMILFAVLGYFLKKFDFPALPLVLGLLLGGTAESALRQALVLSGGSPAIFFTRPIACVMMIISICGFLFPVIKNARAKKGGVHQ